MSSLTTTPSLDPSILANDHRADLTKEEYFDVLDEFGAQTGRTKLRKEVHRDGDWHASVHIWIIHATTGKILVQKRAACKDSFPSCWDVSCAGHLSAGETAENAAIAELAEELGIFKPSETPFEQFFRPLPTLAREVISQGGKFIDREHTYIYYVEGAFDANEMRLQAEEVEAVQWIELSELVSNMENEVAGYVPISDIDSYARAVFDPIQQRINEIRSSKSQVAIADQ